MVSPASDGTWSGRCRGGGRTGVGARPASAPALFWFMVMTAWGVHRDDSQQVGHIHLCIDFTHCPGSHHESSREGNEVFIARRCLAHPCPWTPAVKEDAANWISCHAMQHRHTKAEELAAVWPSAHAFPGCRAVSRCQPLVGQVHRVAHYPPK